MKQLWCRLTSHQPVTLTVGTPESGGGEMIICLRCRHKFSTVTWERGSTDARSDCCQ